MSPRVLIAVAAALFVSDAASAAYLPRLSADHVPNGVEITFRQTAADDATASLAVYVPPGYASTHTTASSGTTIGRVAARAGQRSRFPGV
jgi:hypothetical protein